MKWNFSNYIQLHYVQLFLSIFIGFGLAMVFRRTCNDSSCIFYKAPSPDIIRSKIFKHGDKCYRYTPQLQQCNQTLQYSNEEVDIQPNVSSHKHTRQLVLTKV